MQKLSDKVFNEYLTRFAHVFVAMIVCAVDIGEEQLAGLGLFTWLSARPADLVGPD
jgi:hypothetical protein